MADIFFGSSDNNPADQPDYFKLLKANKQTPQQWFLFSHTDLINCTQHYQEHLNININVFTKWQMQN